MIMNHKINKKYILDGLQERINKLAREIAEKKRLDLEYERRVRKNASLRHKLKHGRGRPTKRKLVLRLEAPPEFTL